MIIVHKWVPELGTTTFGHFKDSRALLTALGGSRENQSNPIFREAMARRELFITEFGTKVFYHSNFKALKAEYYAASDPMTPCSNFVVV